MKRVLKSFLILLIGLCPVPGQGQELLAGFTNQPGGPATFLDSIAIYSLLNRSFAIQKRQPELALQYYRSALEQCSHGPAIRYKAAVYSSIASCYADQRDYNKSIDFMHLSLEAHAAQGRYPFKQFFLLSYLYEKVAAYRELIALYHKARSLSPRNASDTNYLCKMMYIAACAYSKMGKDDSASMIHYKVIAMARRSDTASEPLLLAYSGLANILVNLQQWYKAGQFMDLACALAVRNGDSTQVMSIIANKGVLYFQQKNYSKAREYLYPALVYARAKANLELTVGSAHMIGEILLTEQRYKEALSYAREAYRASKRSRVINNWLKSSHLMARVYTHTGLYSLALKYLEPTVQYAVAHDVSSINVDSYDDLSTIYEGLGQYRKALHYKQKQFQLYDAMVGAETAERIAEVEAKYKTAEKDKMIVQKELLLVRQQSRIRDKNIWIGVLGTGGMLLSVLILGLYTRKRQKEKLQDARIINMEQDREIVALKARMEGEEEERARLARDLHDGVVVKFSAVKMNLSILPEQHNSLEDASDFQKIIRRLDEATTELRATAHNLLPDTLLEGGLTEAIHYFCKEIQQSSGLLIDIQQYTDIPRFQPGFELSVYRIVQELVQNVLKHAGASRILVEIVYHDILSITIEDNGKGFDTTAECMTGGIGIRNLRSRVASLNGCIDIRSAPGKGTSVYIEFIPSFANA